MTVDVADPEHSAQSHPPAGPRALIRLWPWARVHRTALVVMLVTACAALLAQSVVPLVIGAVVDGPIRHHDTTGIWWLSALVLVLGVGEAVLFFVRRYAMASAATGIESDIRRDVFAHLQRLQVAFHDHWPSGQLLSRLTTDLSTVRRFVGFGFVFLVANAATIVFVLVLLVHLNLWLGLFVVVAMIPLALSTRRFELRYARDARRAQDLTGDLATAVEESALGIRVIKSFGRRRHMLASFTRDAERLRGAEIVKLRTLGWFWAVLEGLPQLILAGVAWGGVLAVRHGTMSEGDFVAFLLLYVRLVWPIVMLGWLLALFEETATATGRIFEVLDTEPTIVDPVDPARLGGRGVAPPAATPPAPTASLPGAPPLPWPGGPPLRFEGVRFRFPDSDDDVLRGVDLEVAAGETMALVGAVGSGKTTLTSLVSRLFDVTGGRITLGGVDVRGLPLDKLRSAVSVAFEDATLFSASVRENLTLGRPGITEDDVAEALEVAQAGFVHELPFGLDTRIGEQGMSLSGGQRQRLALARAILGRPRVLVLDDPLSALDVHTEAVVEAALRRVLASTTALVVAHRASTVLLADRVALLDGGRITAVGSHTELLATVPAYRDLLSQSADLEAAPGERVRAR